MHPLTYSMFVPMFFISIGLQADAPGPGRSGRLHRDARGGRDRRRRPLGCGVFARLCGFDTRESLRVGVGMISRGEVGLIVAGYGLTEGLIGREVFSASVLVVLATTMVTPPLLRLVFQGRQFAPAPALIEETIAGPPLESHR